ncbi:5-hydroxytryptamine receptor 2A-like [Clytia hemisphaerica]|uniref:5-hydroxytryptamine receptor 2A-like n=1 Tax=Clytia hemisphaerica TaxID=252671 RepID=UPI0034D4BEE3
MADCSVEWAPRGLPIFTLTTSALISTISVISNVAIVVAFIKDPLKKLHTPFNYFIISLSASDLITGFVVMPISMTTHYLESQRTIDASARYAIRISYLIASTGSTLSIIALSVDRFAAIEWPMRYRQNLGYVKCIIVTIALWVIAVSLPFLYFLIGYRNYLMVHANLSLVLGIGLLFIIYVRVYLYLRKNSQDLRKNLQLTSSVARDFDLKRMLVEKKATRTFLVILLLYVVTYLPAVIFIYIIFFCKNCTCDFIHVIRDTQFLLVASNSCVNAFVCTFRIKHFRQSIRIVFTRNGRKVSDLNLQSTSHSMVISPAKSRLPNNNTEMRINR